MIRRNANSQSGRRLRRRTVPLAAPPTAPPAPAPPDSLRVRLAWGATFAIVGLALIWVLRPVFAVLAASAGLAYILDPAADWLERRGISREGAIGIIFTTLLGSLTVTVLLFLPGFIAQAEQISDQLSPFVEHLDEHIDPVLTWVSEKTGRTVALDLGDLQRQAPGWITEQLPKAQERASAVASGLFTQGLGLLNAVLNLTLMPIFVFYLLRDWDKLIASLAGLIPPRFRARADRVAHEVDSRLGAFIRGQITVCAALAGLYSVGLLLVGIDLAVPVGVLSGVLFIVPYLGTVVGIVMATVLALMKFGVGWELAQVAIVFAVVQAIEGYLLTPRIVGDKVGLHPLVVMIALIVGGSLMGIWGMFLAIPITAVASVFGLEWLGMYKSSNAYTPK